MHYRPVVCSIINLYHMARTPPGAIIFDVNPLGLAAYFILTMSITMYCTGEHITPDAALMGDPCLHSGDPPADLFH
jgi:hypothetical protein